MNKKYMAIIAVAIAIVAIIGGNYVYGYYENQKFEENFKLQYYYMEKAKQIENENQKIGTKTYYTQNTFDTAKNQLNNNLDQEIDYLNKGISYEEQMVNYSPSEAYKKYAEALLNQNKNAKEYAELWKQKITLATFSGITDQNKYNDLNNQMICAIKNMNTFADEKDKIKIQNPELNHLIENLSNETNTVLN